MKERSLVNPRPLKGFSKERVIYIPMDSPFQTLYKSFQEKILKEKRAPFGKVFLLRDKMILYGTMSAPLAVLALENLIASGAREIIIFGFCGSIRPGSKVGEAVSITKAISEEGTSSHYFPRRNIFSPSPSLKQWIEAELDSLKLPYFQNILVTTDAPYRETPFWLQKNLERTVGCVDMEASAVFALAQYYGLQAAALLLVSDVLSGNKHTTGFLNPRLHLNMKKYFLPFILEK